MLVHRLDIDRALSVNRSLNSTQSKKISRLFRNADLGGCFFNTLF
jgi:hypothetical protein